MNSNPKYNGSGCKDPTAYAVMQKISKEESDSDKKAGELIKVIKILIRGFGFEPINRIAIRENKTGKEYR